MIKLGVNIDHIATIRNARGENHPNIIEAAKYVKRCGADSVTIHLREDRRHIKDTDLINILKLKNTPINLEISTNKKMVNIALKKKTKLCLFSTRKQKRNYY